MISSSVVVEAMRLKWFVQMSLICPDGTHLIVSETGYWVRSPRDKSQRRTGTAASVEAAKEEAARGQDLGGRFEWLRVCAADAGDGVLVYVYPLKDEWRFLIKLGSEARFVGKCSTEAEAKLDAETTLNKARMRAEMMPAMAQPWGRG